MSAKARDGLGRWRSKTIGIRISPEENAELDTLVALSGMTKQDYCINRMDVTHDISSTSAGKSLYGFHKLDGAFAPDEDFFITNIY